MHSNELGQPDAAQHDIQDTTPAGMAALCRSRGMRRADEFASYVRGRLGLSGYRALRDAGALDNAWTEGDGS